MTPPPNPLPAAERGSRNLLPPPPAAGRRGLRRGFDLSRNDILDHVRFLHAGQLVVQAAVEVRQPAVVQAHQVQDGGVQVADVAAVDDGLVAELVGLAVAGAALDAAAGQPVGEALGVVVAAAVVALRRPAAGRTRRPRRPASRPAGRAASGRSAGRGSAGRSPGRGSAGSPRCRCGRPSSPAVAAAGVDLHEAHAALDQPPGDQALPAEVRRAPGQPVSGRASAR